MSNDLLAIMLVVFFTIILMLVLHLFDILEDYFSVNGLKIEQAVIEQKELKQLIKNKKIVKKGCK